MNNIARKRNLLLRAAGCAGTIMALVATSLNVSAGLPTQPDRGRFASVGSAQSVGRLSGQALAGVELFAGDLRVLRGGRAYSAQLGMSIGSGDAIMTGNGAPARIKLKGGDFIHVAGGSLFGIGSFGSSIQVYLWSGELVAYALPSLQGKSGPLVINTPEGQVEMVSGKAAVAVDASKVTTVTGFVNRARWLDNRGSASIFARGQVITSAMGKQAESRLDAEEGKRITASASPEVPAVRAAIKTFKNQDYRNAKTQFMRVQAIFPFNGQAAYYLGLILLDAGDDNGAIKQWQHYVKVDPEGAKRNDIQKHLTVLISKQIGDEIKIALANEARISNSPPEPNSVAVAAFTPRGMEKYNMLSKGIAALIISDLAKVPDLKVLERQKIQKLMDELKLAKSGLVSSESGARAGKLLKAEKIVIGDYEVKVE